MRKGEREEGLDEISRPDMAWLVVVALWMM